MHFDFAILEGHRSYARQRELYADGRSKLDGRLKRSKHQESPSLAVDVMPWPPELHGVNIWDDAVRWGLFIGKMKGIAELLGIPVRCGIDWNDDGSCKDHKFIDSPHIELA